MRHSTLSSRLVVCFTVKCEKWLFECESSMTSQIFVHIQFIENFSKLFLLVIYIQASVQRFFCRKLHCVFASLAWVHNPDDISICSAGLAEHVVVSDYLAALHATSLSGLCITQFSQSINIAVAYHRPRGRDRPYSWVLDARQAWL